MENDIKIRLMEESDFEDGSFLMSYAFKGKLPALKKFDEKDVADFMLAGGLFQKESLEGHYVAILNNKVVGIMHLDTYSQQKNKIDAPLQSEYIIKKFGLIRSLISGISFLLLGHHLKKDEMIVDYIAVHPDFRGHGIGGNLLDFGEKIAKKTSGISRYTLRVIGKNIGAKRLYERKGFSVIKTRRALISSFFTGVKVYHNMEKII